MYPIVCFFAGWFLQKTRHKISINKTSASDTPRACVSVCVLKATIIFAVSVEIRKTHSPFHRCIDSLFFNQYHTRLPLETYWYFFHRKIACFCYLFIFFKYTSYFFLLHKVHKSCPFDLHGLTLSVIQRQDEMEKIGFSEVGRGLLFVMCPCQAHAAAGREEESMSVKQRTPGTEGLMEERGWWRRGEERRGASAAAEARSGLRGERFLDLSQ